jgi:hypothetical protein
MPALTKCAHTGCTFEGPHGFSETPPPWGRHFYHAGCPGFWVGDNGATFDNEAAAYRDWKRSNPRDPDWERAFDARILRGDHTAYERLIKIWRDKP